MSRLVIRRIGTASGDAFCMCSRGGSFCVQSLRSRAVPALRDSPVITASKTCRLRGCGRACMIIGGLAQSGGGCTLRTAGLVGKDADASLLRGSPLAWNPVSLLVESGDDTGPVAAATANAAAVVGATGKRFEARRSALRENRGCCC